VSLYDISMRLHRELIRWPGSTAPEQGWDTRLDRGEESNASHWLLGSHNGTHVEAPWHFLADGSQLAEIPLDMLIGPAHVVQVPDGAPVINESVVRSVNLPSPGGRVLFRTGNVHRLAAGAFDPSYVAIDVSGARALVDAGIGLVAIDYISVEPYGQADFPVHRTLLGAGIVIVEGVDLSGVGPGEYRLHCLPLLLDNSEAGPARAVLETL
jgi:arylformamidase